MKDTVIYFSELATPVGPLTILIEGEETIRIDFGPMSRVNERITRWINRYFKNPKLVKDDAKAEQLKQEIDEYFTKRRRVFNISYRFHGTEFQKQVWHALLDTDYGQVKSYQDIATAIQNEKAVRAVGGAIGKNPLSIVVPCHRIIGKNGQLTGFGGGLTNKERLLKLEGYL